MKTSADELINDGPQLEVPASAFFMLVITVFIDNLAATISSPVMPYYAQQFKISTAQIGYLFSAWSFSATVFAPVLTQWSDKIGRRPIIIMSLVGAGIANLMQSSALGFGSWGYSVFLFGRLFSGMWASVMATCNVYIADVCPEEFRASYVAKLTTVPAIAMLFGPGIGGGLSKLSPNYPILVDGVVTLFAAILVACYLPETPAFLRARRSHSTLNVASGKDQDNGVVPFSVHLLGVTQFLNGIAFSCIVSCSPLMMMERLDFDGLRVGFVTTAGSLSMIAVSVWAIPWAAGRVDSTHRIMAGLAGSAVGMLMLSVSYSACSVVCGTIIVFGAMAMRSASMTEMVGGFTDQSNRGKIFGLSQVYANVGRTVGPILATNMADRYGIGSAFVLGSTLTAVSAVFVILAARALKPKEQSIARRGSQYGEDWKDEVGSAADVEALGKHMAVLLARKHYKWVSNRDQVFRYLDQMIPELEIKDREVYKQAMDKMFQSKFA